MMFRRTPRPFLATLVALFTLPLMVAAAPARKGAVEVELVSEVASIAPGQPFTVALRMQHEPHWHSYWLAAGTGYATSLAWTLPARGAAPVLPAGRWCNIAQALAMGLADHYGNLDYVAREVVKAEDIVDYTQKENVAERLAKRFGAAVGEGAVRTLGSSALRLR